MLIGCGGARPGEGPGSGSATIGQVAPGQAGGERGGGSGADGGEEGSGANTLAPNEAFDAVRSGTRLILNYDAASNTFKGMVENATNNVLAQVRIEVHLSTGTKLGPTTPIYLAPAQVATVNLPSTPESFTGWVAHAEVGSRVEGSQSGGEGDGEWGSEGSAETSGEGGGEGGGSADLANRAATTGVRLNGRRQRVRRVRVLDEQRAIPIRDPAGRPFKGYRPGGNDFVDV